jgi:hypothetical protein
VVYIKREGGGGDYLVVRVKKIRDFFIPITKVL